MVNNTIKVKIAPRCNVSNAIVGLQVVLTIGSPRVDDDGILVTTGTTGNQCLIPRQIEASDASGPLRLQPRISPQDSTVSWIVSRKTSGDVTLKYRTVPLSEATRTIWKATGLYSDQGGLIGSGLAFIPVPPGDESYQYIVEWDLSQAPVGTRAVWTFGEGPSPVEKSGPTSTLTETVYMVGPVRSNPPAPIPGSISDYYGFYWFGILPQNIDVIKEIHHDFLLKVSEFFDETPTADDSYRSFILNSGSSMSTWGTSLIRSHIFAYDDQVDAAKDYDLVRRMSYEMSHIYLGPSVTRKDSDWLYEGIKNCLSIYMPFRNGFRTGDYFQATINVLCVRYYTSPLVNMPLDDLIKLSATIVGAREHLEARAWAFVISTDLKARRMSDLKRPLEDLAIKPLAKLRAGGQPHGIEQFIELLQPLMGDEITKRYDDFVVGRTFLLPVDLFGTKTHCLMQVGQEYLDFGMDQKSYKHGVVLGLKNGSRAAEVGLKDGDKITWCSHQWICVDQFEAEVDIVVERDGEEMPFRYWPRKYEKAKSWQMVKREDHPELPPPAPWK